MGEKFEKVFSMLRAVLVRRISRWCGMAEEEWFEKSGVLDSVATVLENKRYTIWAGVTQLVECNLAKVDVASSSLVSRSIPLPFRGSASIPQ